MSPILQRSKVNVVDNRKEAIWGWGGVQMLRYAMLCYGSGLSETEYTSRGMSYRYNIIQLMSLTTVE